MFRAWTQQESNSRAYVVHINCRLLVAVGRVQQPGGELSAGCRVQARPEHRSLHGEQVGTSVADPDPSRIHMIWASWIRFR